MKKELLVVDKPAYVIHWGDSKHNSIAITWKRHRIMTWHYKAELPDLLGALEMVVMGVSMGLCNSFYQLNLGEEIAKDVYVDINERVISVLAPGSVKVKK